MLKVLSTAQLLCLIRFGEQRVLSLPGKHSSEEPLLSPLQELNNEPPSEEVEDERLNAGTVSSLCPLGGT